MNRPIIFVLIALNALLAVVLAVEWVASTESSITQTETKVDNVESEESPPALDLTETSEDSYSDLVDRPMFIKGRKPVDEPVPESAPVVATKKTEAIVWDLTGIFTTPKGVTAFFSRTNAKVSKDNYRKYKVGEELDGWKVSEIHTDNVVLTQMNETKTLLLRKAKPKTPTPIQSTTNNPVAKPKPLAQQQGIPTQNLQTSDTLQNIIAPQSETSEETATPENP